MSFHKRMTDREFRDRQHARLHEPHIEPFTKPVNDLVKDADRGPMPYIAPMLGGTAARVLSLLRSPGPATRAHGCNGMLCIENDDDTAERLAELLDEARIPVAVQHRRPHLHLPA